MLKEATECAGRRGQRPVMVLKASRPRWRSRPATDHAHARPDLLLIDEVGYLSYSNRHADLLFELISRRDQNKSTVVTTNKPFGQWHEVFPNASCVVSLIDRLVHRCEVVAIEGESYRLK